MSHRNRTALVAILLCATCGAPPSGLQPIDIVTTDGGTVQFKIGEISAESAGCADSTAQCARVKASFLETTGGGTEVVRENIDLFLSHDLISRMRGHLPEDVGNGINDAEGLAGAFLAEHRAFVADFPEANAEWVVEITAASTYNTPEVATIEIAEFAYTGGAHPNSRRRFVSFDVATGNLLGVEDLARDLDALTALFEQQLRTDRGIGADDDLEAAGFWIPEEGFTLPDNVGVVTDGLMAHWNAYEIAPYSMGAIDVFVPAGELTGVIDRSYW